MIFRAPYSGSMEWSSVFRNISRAALLDVDFYNRAEVDTSLNVQAVAVVVIASGLAGFGSAVATGSNLLAAAGLSAVTGVLGWLLWSFVAMIVGTKIFGGTSDFGQMCRVIGFAYAPLGIGVIPWLGFPGAVWVLVAAVIAIREGMDFSTKRSIATMIVGWGAWLLATVVLNLLLDWEMRSAWPF
ncbi:MAG: hypothetical protein BMS9Abin20_0378 [Acidimicrobiia bacterium]|nr:MAG: hypothetical protein BMS9Abin20_0378 [Acidimicrobiia bacterium]